MAHVLNPESQAIMAFKPAEFEPVESKEICVLPAGSIAGDHHKHPTVSVVERCDESDDGHSCCDSSGCSYCGTSITRGEFNFEDFSESSFTKSYRKTTLESSYSAAMKFTKLIELLANTSVEAFSLKDFYQKVAVEQQSYQKIIRDLRACYHRERHAHKDTHHHLDDARGRIIVLEHDIHHIREEHVHEVLILKEKIEKLQKEITIITEKHDKTIIERDTYIEKFHLIQKELKETREKHEKYVKELKEKHEKYVKEVRETHEKKIKEIRETHERVVREIKESHERKIREITERHEKIIREHKEIVKELKETHEKSIKILKETHETMIKELKETYEKKIVDITKSFESKIVEIREHSEKIVRELKEKYEKEIRDIRVTNETKIVEIRESHEKIVKELREKTEKEIREIRESHTREITSIKESYESKIVDIRKTHETTIRELKESHTREITIIQKEKEEKNTVVITELTERIHCLDDRIHCLESDCSDWESKYNRALQSWRSAKSTCEEIEKSRDEFRKKVEALEEQLLVMTPVGGHHHHHHEHHDHHDHHDGHSPTIIVDDSKYIAAKAELTKTIGQRDKFEADLKIAHVKLTEAEKNLTASEKSLAESKKSLTESNKQVETLTGRVQQLEKEIEAAKKAAPQQPVKTHSHGVKDGYAIQWVMYHNRPIGEETHLCVNHKPHWLSKAFKYDGNVWDAVAQFATGTEGFLVQNETLGGDPAVSKKKTMVVAYTFGKSSMLRYAAAIEGEHLKFSK